MIGTDLLHDLFTNNIDFGAKQLQTIIDHLFPHNEDNSETPVNVSDLPIILTGQCKVQYGGIRYNNQWYYGSGFYNVNYSSESLDNSLTFLQYEQNNNIPSEVYQQYRPETIYFKNTEDLPVNHLYSDGRGNFSLNNGNIRQNMLWGGDYSPTDLNIAKNSAGYIGYRNDIYSLGYAYSGYSLYFLTDGNAFVISDDINTSTYIYNNCINYNNDYHTYNTYNFNGGSGNGGGTVYVGGGAGGLVVGLAGAVGYADIKFSLDSLIHDLNLNFSNPDNVFPVNEFPSYNDIKYEDMGSFYITPIQQIDTLPDAPDVGDTIPDVSDYLTIVGGALTSFYNMVDGLGVSLILLFTFLMCLVINHLKKG